MRFTLFNSATDRGASRHDGEWADICASFVSNPPSYPNKESCPLLKLGVFGNAPSDKGFLRNDANVVAISGVELDYDGEVVPMERAADLLRNAGVRCALYTSASHKPDRPRWRVLAPLSTEYGPEYRRAFVAFFDGALGGIAARESYTLSQSYYYGCVEDVEYQSVIVDGRNVDELVEPVASPIGPSSSVDVPEWRPVDLERLHISDDVKALIRDGAPEGERSEALMVAANALAKARVHPDDMLRVLSDPKNGISAKALSGRRQAAAMEWLAKHTVRKALEAFPPIDQSFAPPPFPATPKAGLLVNAADLAAMSFKPRWLVEGVLEEGVFGVVFGQPGAGKSFVTMGWAASIAAGVKWNGRPTRSGAVVYVAGEGFAGLGRRVAAWAAHAGVPIPNKLHFTRRSVAINDPASIGELIGEIDAIPDRPTLIVIDTLARATPGLDLDKAKDMAVFVRACDQLRERFNCAVLVVHHSGHGDKGRAMNSIALLGAIDFEAGVTRESDDVLRLKSTKMKDCEPFEDVCLRFERVEFLTNDRDPNVLPVSQSSVVLVECDAPKTAAKSGSSHMSILREIVRTSGGSILHATALADFLRLHGGKPVTARRAYYKVLGTAVDEGLLTHDEATGMIQSTL